VTCGEKPLNRGRIVFFHPSGQAVGADLGANGTFKLTAFQGANQIAIQCFDQPLPSPEERGRIPTKPPKSLIPERYIQPDTSGLTFDVKPGENEEAKFTLKAPVQP
jgi:hypothetical protein